MIPDANDNPAVLKLMLAQRGIADAHRSGTIELMLDGEVPARARANPRSPISLADSAEGSMLKSEGASVPVRIIPEPRFATRCNARGVPLGNIVEIRGGYATVALGGGCGFATPGRACAFCLGRELTEKAGEQWPVDEVVEAVRAAFDEGDAEFVHFCLGYFPGDDAGLLVLRPYLDAIHRHFDTIAAVTMHPPASPRVVEMTYAGGVDIISYNLEAPDEDSMQRYLPGRARFFGRQRYLDALRHAARIFPSGAVWSELMIDLASKESIAAAIDHLTAMHVVPLLGISSKPRCEIDFDGIQPLFAHLFDAVLKAGISMTWARDIAGTITPLEARYFVPDPPQIPLLIHQLARNRLGALTARSLARLRRRLRVKRVRASFDSSHL